MIQETYCSFEVAKLLKEKGFDGGGGDAECHMFYSEFTEGIMPITEIGLVPYKEVIFAPTHQMTIKWLREKHGFHCFSEYYYILGWCCGVTSLNELISCEEYNQIKQYFPDIDSGFSSSEEAIEAALKYCLERLIKN